MDGEEKLETKPEKSGAVGGTGRALVVEPMVRHKKSTCDGANGKELVKSDYTGKIVDLIN